MNNEEAILVLKSTSVNLGRRGGRTAYAEALEMAITALENNSNDEVNNSTNNSTNEIKSRVKGMTACRVPKDKETIDDDTVCVVFCNWNVAKELVDKDENIEDCLVLSSYLDDDEAIVVSKDEFLDWVRGNGALPSVQPDDKLTKIADLVEGTIDHFDLDDAIDLLYQIKEVLK